MALENSKKQEDQRRKPFKNYGRKPEEKGILILKFGKANNFYKFRAALSNEATEKFGNLGKLIDLEEYYLPELEMQEQGFSEEQAERMNFEVFKEQSRKLTKMEDN
jgi:hypothetical protein